MKGIWAWPVGVLAGLLAAGDARAAFCGACSYSAPAVTSSDQCALPAVKHRIRYEPVTETHSQVCYRPGLPHGHGTGVLHRAASRCTSSTAASSATPSASRSPSSTTTRCRTRSASRSTSSTSASTGTRQPNRSSRSTRSPSRTRPAGRCTNTTSSQSRTRSVGRWSQEYQVAVPYTIYRPGVRAARPAGAATRVPRTVVQEYQVQVPYTVCRPVYEQHVREHRYTVQPPGRRVLPGGRPVHDLPQGIRAARPRAPLHGPPAGRAVLPGGGPVHDLPAGLRARTSARSGTCTTAR